MKRGLPTLTGSPKQRRTVPWAEHKGLFLCSAEERQEPPPAPTAISNTEALKEREGPNNPLHQRRANTGTMPSPPACANTAGDLASIPPASRERPDSLPGEPAGCCCCRRLNPFESGLSKRATTTACSPRAGHTRPEHGPPSHPSPPQPGGTPPTRGERPRGGTHPGRAAISGDPAGQPRPRLPTPPPRGALGVVVLAPTPRPATYFAPGLQLPSRPAPGPARRFPRRGRAAKFSTAHAPWRCPRQGWRGEGNTPRRPALGTAGQPPPSSLPLPPLSAGTGRRVPTPRQPPPPAPRLRDGHKPRVSSPSLQIPKPRSPKKAL